MMCQCLSGQITLVSNQSHNQINKISQSTLSSRRLVPTVSEGKKEYQKGQRAQQNQPNKRNNNPGAETKPTGQRAQTEPNQTKKREAGKAKEDRGGEGRLPH